MRKWPGCNEPSNADNYLEVFVWSWDLGTYTQFHTDNGNSIFCEFQTKTTKIFPEEQAY